MPEYTSGYSIPYPSPGDPIRGSIADYIRTDLRDMALATDAAIGSILGADARFLPPNSNINDFRGTTWEGKWAINSGSVLSTVTGLPDGAGVGVLTVDVSTGFQTYRGYVAQGSPRIWVRGIKSTSSGEWSEWGELSTGTSQSVADAGAAALGHKVRQDRARARRGGRIGTAGRGVVALRFDDYPDDFASTVLPVLRQHQLPSYFALTVRHVEDLSSQSWTDVAAWASDGVEFFGHSWSHSAASGVSALKREIIDSANYFETQMPGVAIDGWVQPGTGEGADGYNGFGTGESVSDYTDLPAGRMILSRYGVVNGGIPGYLAPLTGAPSVGQIHVTIETYTVAEVQAIIRRAQATGSGVSLMIHPANLGQTGYMSVADFEALMAWIAAERDAERLLVLTGSGLAFADSSTDQRMNLLPSLDSLTGWGGTTGWSVANGVASGTTSAGGLTYSIPGQAINALRGSVLEVAALVRAPSGAVVRTALTGTASVSVDHTASPSWQWVRAVTTLPANASWSGTLTAQIGRASGGAVEMAGLAVRPV